jgi:hypothetical protein
VWSYERGKAGRLALEIMAITVVQRKPSVEEFQSIVASVGFRAHDKSAVEIALRNTVLCDGKGIHSRSWAGSWRRRYQSYKYHGPPFAPASWLWVPHRQGSCSCVEALPYKNIVLEVVPLPGSVSFYERFGFKASRNAPPGMVRWFNDERAAHS